MLVRAATSDDRSSIWAILEPVFRAGDSYTVDPDISRDDALAYWCGPPSTAFVVEDRGRVAGTHYIRRNHGGGGGHVCNCGYVTDPAASGKGVARAMLEHSQETARAMGFRAMQFNFVVASNTRAVALWRAYGFDIIGRLPGAFKHPDQSYGDALVMWKSLV